MVSGIAEVSKTQALKSFNLEHVTGFGSSYFLIENCQI